MNAKINMTPEELRNLIKFSFTQGAHLTIGALNDAADLRTAKRTLELGKTQQAALSEILDQGVNLLFNHCIFGGEEK